MNSSCCTGWEQVLAITGVSSNREMNKLTVHFSVNFHNPFHHNHLFPWIIVARSWHITQQSIFFTADTLVSFPIRAQSDNVTRGMEKINLFVRWLENKAFLTADPFWSSTVQWLKMQEVERLASQSQASQNVSKMIKEKSEIGFCKPQIFSRIFRLHYHFVWLHYWVTYSLRVSELLYCSRSKICLFVFLIINIRTKP